LAGFCDSQGAFLGEVPKLAIRANFFNALNLLNLAPLIPATAQTDIANASQFGRTGAVLQEESRISGEVSF